ncbi:SDR family oxidoreductase [Bacillus sp. B15-48]|nr:SDR family oxidoreductase [Bacillus sp. B15-48]
MQFMINDGIGKEIAKTMAKAGASVLVTGMDEERTKTAATEIAEQTGADLDYYVGGLSLEENVSAMVENAEEVVKQIERVPGVTYAALVLNRRD